MDIPLHVFESLESTSSYAQELLANKGQSLPFAIAAMTQSKGRGRRGHEWHSPSGGLYLTMAIENPTFTDKSNLNHAPLQAAVCLCSWLESRFHIRFSLKWPNDILFRGRKLAGLLCESHIQGDRWGPLLIGIGINMASAPKTSAAYDSICLKQITNCGDDPLELARDLVKVWPDLWKKFSDRDQLREGFERYQIDLNQPWMNEQDAAQLFLNQGIDGDGQFCLKGLNTEEIIKLTSVTHGFRWIYQDKEGPWPLIAADIGNTACKFAYFSRYDDPEPKAIRSFVYDADGMDDVESLLEWHPQSLVTFPIYGLSVNPNRESEIFSRLNKIGFAPVLVGKRPVRYHGDAYDFQNLGADRLAMIEGWLANLPLSQRHQDYSGLLVSAGTATTLDWVRGDGRHCGGLILPGLQMALDSLSKQTALLPQLHARSLYKKKSQHHWGWNTQSALALGCLKMTIDTVHQCRKSIIDRMGSTDAVGISITGGFAEVLSRELEIPPTPSLVLRGLQAMILGG
jgi:biotin-[acetyl-CoA-carboxylase] ligase BirA-like protein